MLKHFLLLAALLALVGCDTTRYISAPSLMPPTQVADQAPPPPAYRPATPPGQSQRPANAMPPQVGAVRGRVVIDPGHGGKDPGTHAASGMVEKRLTLSLGQAAASRLRSHGVDVRMTRSDDTFIELDDRAYAASTFRADLFVSIHADWNPSSSKHGHTILLPQSHTPGAAEAAHAISRSLVAAGWPCYGIRTDTRGLVVLRKTTCPAVLVEIGFLSNPSDAAQLASPAFQARLGQAVADGIAAYLKYR